MLVCPLCERVFHERELERCPDDGSLLYLVGDDSFGLMDIPLGPGAIVAQKYRLLAEIKRRGGAGRTFKAEQLNLQRVVELRMLPTNSISKPGDHERFRREVATWGRIQDDHLVRLYDSGYADGSTPYMVLEYFDGGMVGDILREHGPFPIGWLHLVADHVLQALVSAHGAQVLHRDITPDAIIVSQNTAGVPHFRLTVFGLAKHLNDDDDPTAITMTGQVLGQPAYMAPETITQGVLEPRTDLYALGITLFELAAGRRPFTGKSLADILGEQIQADPPSLASIRPDLPSEFCQFVHTLIQKKPQNRFSAADEALRFIHLDSAADEPRDTQPPIQKANGPGPSPLWWAFIGTPILTTLTIVLLSIV